jgi:glycosyltransferase involved in cell wall biosynthesis
MFDEDEFTETEYHPSKNQKKIVFMGRLQKDKGIFELLDIIPLFKKYQKNIRFIFIGWYSDEETKKKVLEIIKSNSMDEYCEFTGFLEGKEKIRKLSQSDIFVFPSYREGCPTAVIEALAIGLFIVATDVGAINEIIQDGINGYLVKPKDTSDLHSKVEKALNRDDLSNIRKINKKRAFENFSSKSVVTIMSEIYQKTLE